MFTVLSDYNQALYHTDKEPTSGNYVHGKRSIGMFWNGSRMVSTRAITDAERRATATVRISAKRDELINGGMTFQTVRYQTRPGDRENIMGAATAALGAIVNGSQVGDLRWHGGDTDFTWIAEDNTETPMDAHTLYAFGQAAMAHKQALIFHARFLKDAVAAADTQQELDAVNIETGWPGQ